MEKGKLDSSMDEKSTSSLESMLKELVSYKHAGDMSDMSPEVQVLLRHEEESQAREEARHASRRLKGRRPRERRRGRDSSGEPAAAAACSHAGGSLDNIAAESCSGAADGKTKGVAGRTAEGGSCFNLSRGSFEPALRRQRQQQGGSLEDLGAIDESAAGLLETAAKSGGSLQNLSQQPGEQPAGTESAEAPDGEGETAAATGARPDASGAVVIQMAEDDEDSGEESAARLAVRALAAPCAAEEAPERGTSLQERPRHTLSLEEGGGVLQAVAAAVSAGARRRTTADAQIKQTRKKPSAAAAERSSDLRCLTLGQTCTMEEFDVSRAVLMAARRGQTLDGGGGGASGSSSGGSRLESSRPRKNRKKPETTVTTDSVANYQGRNDVDDLIKFIESGGPTKPAGAPEKNGRKAERAGRRDVKGRRSGEERAARQDRRAAAGRRPTPKPASPDPAAARSASLQARPAAGESTADHSRLCGDLAQPRPAAAPAPAPSALWARDGVTCVSAAPAAAGDEFVRDFYSVTDEAAVPEESEFHVVTRRQRRRPAARAYSGPAPETVRTPGAGSWRPSRVGPGDRPALSARSVTNSEETSDADSDGAASAPAAGRAAPPSDSGVASASSNSAASSASSASSACSISSPSAGFSAASSAAASWADVAKPKPADAAAQTDFIDGVGAIFGDRSPARAVRPTSLARGDSEPRGAKIGGAYPDEFPAIPAPPAVAAAADAAAAASPASPASTSAAPAPAVVSAAASTVSVMRSAAAAAPPPVPARAVTAAAPRVNGGPSPSAAAAGRSRRAPAVEIPATVLPGDAGRAGGGARMPDIQFGYIDTDVTEAPAAVIEPPAAAAQPPPQPEAKAATSGVDGFCRRFRSQPVDVSQFNWREVSVFLSKVYSEAVRVSAAPREVPCSQRL